MKRLVIGILAHVDAGKTTLSEGLLYQTGAIRSLGRVDHGDAFLDTDKIERERGITIFSKQAMLETDTVSFTLLDTPGHVDFSAEMERSLRVLDYAILVISGADGVQSHTETLWKMLRHYDVPTFIFVNKMDLPTADADEIYKALCLRLDSGCVSFAKGDETFYENVAIQSDRLLNQYLTEGDIPEEEIVNAIAARQVFPVYFGSALKNIGIAEFWEGFCRYTAEKKYPKDFGAKVFKIAEDEKGQRICYMKITGGSLSVKSVLEGKDWSRKINELRIYSGMKFTSVPEAFAGSVCTVPGLDKAYPGEGLGFEQEETALLSEPVLSYGVVLPEGTDVLSALAVFRKIEAEETQLHVLWNELLAKIDVQVMGEVQLEVLKEILETRFGLAVSFTSGSIIYKETIRNTVEGVGHFEPLRHYAEVHLLLEPGKRGSGVIYGVRCPEDSLAKNWQRLILSHLEEKTHLGVLTGAPITDIKITLIAGKAHVKHTEGGDFRQATYRAVRQGLMQAESVLLEPWYNFTLELPKEAVGRALTDLERMGATFSSPEVGEITTVIRGRAPVSKIREYHTAVLSFTHGMGRLFCTYDGYDVCTDASAVIAASGYNPEADIANTPDSVFCSHGAGTLVKWDEVFGYMHIPTLEKQKEEAAIPIEAVRYRRMVEDDETLLAIYERTYGKIQRKNPGHTLHTPHQTKEFKAKPVPVGPTYLLVDGYNIIFAWDVLSRIAEENLEAARELLIRRLCNYQALRQSNLILVFDAYRVKGNNREIEEIHGISVVYTKEAETADAYIEKTTKELVKHYRVRVATSDRLEQIIVFGQGVQRVSASEFLSEVEAAEKEMRDFIAEHNR
ncbi:MAG: GTP-binding protein [Ruminococcaceae bacterium]|nr:GTP-binding protein [Oscillospiraceae bacterium]